MDHEKEIERFIAGEELSEGTIAHLIERGYLERKLSVNFAKLYRDKLTGDRKTVMLKSREKGATLEKIGEAHNITKQRVLQILTR